MTRRALLACAVLLACACNGGPTAPARPNVVVLVMDTTRADRCSLLGYERPTTPELERLAAEATTFTNCWSPCSWTGPAHASLFTGLRPENHGFRRAVRPYLDPSAETLAEHFQRAGYATAGVTNNPNAGALVGLDQGFETFEELFEMGTQRVPDVTSRTPLPAELPLRTHPPAEVGHAIALGWVREQVAAERPFFLFVNDMEPHLPYTAPREIERGFVAPGTPAATVAWGRRFAFPLSAGYCLGEVDLTPDRVRVLSDLYDAEIAALDAEVGRLVASLRDLGVLDDTVLVVTSDHGENLGDHGLLDHMFSVHRSLLHVPLLIRYPRAMEAGRRVDDVVRLEDVAPTVLELAGLDVPADLDARSLLAPLAGRVAYAATDSIHEAEVRVLGELFPGAPEARLRLSLRSVFDGRHHLVRDGAGTEWLYDLAADPAEERDLAPAAGPALDAARERLDRVYPR